MFGRTGTPCPVLCPTTAHPTSSNEMKSDHGTGSYWGETVPFPPARRRPEENIRLALGLLGQSREQRLELRDDADDHESGHRHRGRSKPLPYQAVPVRPADGLSTLTSLGAVLSPIMQRTSGQRIHQ